MLDDNEVRGLLGHKANDVEFHAPVIPSSPLKVPLRIK
jgi:hypothetical protein